MKFQRRLRQDIDVNMTPLIDIVFLLLIFFMVSTTFTKESRLGINLPQAVVGDVTPAEIDTVEVLIDANGLFTINGVVLISNDLSTIKNALKETMKAAKSIGKNKDINKKLHLTITADAATAHQFVISTMDVAGQLGFSKLSITTLKIETPK
ncbi:MAG: biopolymer transport protein ExbD [Oceanospirillaceae bacterium]|jgi:biopolymer transport protein ExbD